MEHAQGTLAFKAPVVAGILSFDSGRNAAHVSSLLIGLSYSYEREIKVTTSSQFLTKLRQSLSPCKLLTATLQVALVKQ